MEPFWADHTQCQECCYYPCACEEIKKAKPMTNEELKARVAKMPRAEVNAEIVHLTNEQLEYEKEITTLKAQLSQLQTQLVEQAAEVERLQTAFKQISMRAMRLTELPPSYRKDKPTPGEDYDDVRYWYKHGLESPPPGFGARVLAVARAGWKFAQLRDSIAQEITLLAYDKSADLDGIELWDELCLNSRAVTQQDKEWMGAE